MPKGDSLTRDQIEEAIGPLENFRQQCHAASVALVQSGLVKGRVARGVCSYVRGQHSWVVLGNNCYSPTAHVLDVTAWSYDPTLPKVWYARNLLAHQPHGIGDMVRARRPKHYGGETVPLHGRDKLSAAAQYYLNSLSARGLDHRGWLEVTQMPVADTDGRAVWPAKEIITAMYKTPQLRALVPIDIVGMVTELNPSKLYLLSSTK
jgi:hypothetical protein